MSDIPLSHTSITGNQSVHVVDPRYPWQSLVARNSAAGSALTDMMSLPSNAVKVPPHCKYAEVMGMAATSGVALVANLYGFPPGAVSSGTVAMNQGQLITASADFTTTARTGISISNGTTTGQHQSNSNTYDLRGYYYLAGVITDIDSSVAELGVRFIG